MKISRFVILLSILAASSSCAFFNSNTVDLAVNSNPAGADIFIEGRSYGKTPTVINVAPRRYLVTLSKDGYGSAVFNTETWGTIRTDVNGNTTADGKRCLADTLSVIFFFSAFSERCADFKQKEYFINIPRATSASADNFQSPVVGAGATPNNMINYYYGQNGGAQGGAQPYPNPYKSY